MGLVRIALAAAVVTAPVVVSGPASPSYAAGRTCQGHAATIVGKPEQSRLVGTDGDDVIVTNGAFEVVAKGGDDLICATIAKHDPGQTTSNISAGPGDDVVYGHAEGVFVELGAGADTFVGGPSRDSVWAGKYLRYDYQGPDDAVDGDRDVISTGAGDDGVVLGQPDVESADVVDTGPDHDDVLLMATDMTDEGVVSLGDGIDGLDLWWPSEGVTGTWTFDNVAHRAIDDQGHQLRWDGVDSFSLPDTSMPPPSFVGGDGPESVEAPDFASVDLGGGADTFRLGYAGRYDEAPQLGMLDGGPGRDTLTLEPFGEARIDLAAGTARFAWEALLDTDLTDIENVTTYSGRDPLTIIGDDADNRFEVWGCSGSVSGGGGEDRLTGVNAYCRGHRGVRFSGGPGADRLRGSPGDDVLVGGSGDDLIRGAQGRDTALGGAGHDTCSAEVRRSCP